MKKVLSVVALSLVLALSVAFFGCGLGGLTGGGNKPAEINAQAAVEINSAAQAGNKFTYDDLIEKYGTPYRNKYNSGMGYVTWINCDVEEFDQKIENGEKVSALVVAFTVGQANRASFVEDYEGGDIYI